ADAVAAKLAHHAETLGFGKLLDRPSDVAQARARAHHDDATPHGLVGDGAQAPRGDGGVADDEHAAGIPVPAVLDHGDIDVEDVALLEELVVRNAVADLVVDRGADRLGIGDVAATAVVQGRGNGLL